MTATLKLVERVDETAVGDDISSISLIANTNGFDVEYMSGWTPAVAAGMMPANVIENITLVARGSSHDNFSTLRQALDLKLKQASWYWDTMAEENSVWLRAKLNGETYERQALIRRGQATWGDAAFGPYVDAHYTDRQLPLVLERYPWWEATAVVTDTNLNVDCIGGKVTVDGTDGSDVPGRVSSTYFAPETGDAMDEIWIGFRSQRWGDTDNFVAKWATGLGTVIAGTGTTDEGDWMSCDFSAGDPDGNAMQTRFYVQLNDVTVNYADHRGEFVVLLRAQKTGTDSDIYVRLLDGYSSDDGNLRMQDRVQIRSTEWCLHALGTVRIPPARAGSPARLLSTFRLAIQAELAVDDGDSLYCDYLILIPIGEGGVHVTDMGLAATQYGVLYTSPFGTMSGWTFTDFNLNSVIKTIAPNPQGPYGYTIPAGQADGLTEDSKAYIAFQRETEHDETDQATLTFKVLRRWRTLRGAT